MIEECSTIAKDLGYDNLEFLVGDINDYNDETSVDMVVTLHACDVVTDMALARAVKGGESHFERSMLPARTILAG